MTDSALRHTSSADGRAAPLSAGHASSPDATLRYGQRADSAAVVVLSALLETIECKLDGTIAGTDSECLHDFRVAIRRSRSVQRELKGAFPPEALARFRGEFRWLQQATGSSRDLDVYVLEFDLFRAMLREDIRPDLDPVLAALRRRRGEARRTMVRALESERSRTLRSEWGLLLERLRELPEADRSQASRPIGELAGERIGKVYRRMTRSGGAIELASPPEDYHELRKQGKELRYLLELFGAPLYPSDVVKPMVKALKSLQDVLGRHQDREVQVAMLRSVRDDAVVHRAGPAAKAAVDDLIGRLTEDERSARNEFAVSFDGFASKSQRRLVSETFR